MHKNLYTPVNVLISMFGPARVTRAGGCWQLAAVNCVRWWKYSWLAVRYGTSIERGYRYRFRYTDGRYWERNKLLDPRFEIFGGLLGFVFQIIVIWYLGSPEVVPRLLRLGLPYRFEITWLVLDFRHLDLGFGGMVSWICWVFYRGCGDITEWYCSFVCLHWNVGMTVLSFTRSMDSIMTSILSLQCHGQVGCWIQS